MSDSQNASAAGPDGARGPVGHGPSGVAGESPSRAAGSRPSSAYRDAGVDYGLLDAGKRLAVASALATSPLLAARGGRAIDASRGQPAFVFDHGGEALAMVVEGLGTKSVVARQVQEQLDVNRFGDVAYDTVAAIVNDLCCVGALPLVVTAYFATGASEWYLRGDRQASLVEGWRRGCEDAGCTWGGGESPTLPGLLSAEDIELAGSALGALPAGRKPILGADLKAGDEIVMVASSGLHANGASLARAVADGLPQGYATPIAAAPTDRLGAGPAGAPSGGPGDGPAGGGVDGATTLGEALLAPSIIYAPLVALLMDRGVEVSYISHITGHGLLKLMRPKAELTYRIHSLPAVPPVLMFLADRSGMDARAAYSTLNMGAGYAVYCPPRSTEGVLAAAGELGLEALRAGAVEDGPRRVVLEHVGIEYRDDELALG